MSLVSKLINKNLNKITLDKLDKDQFARLEVAIIKHLLHVTSYREYTKELSWLKIAERKQLRNSAKLDFNIVVALKYSLLNIFKNKGRNKAKIFSDFEIADHSYLLDLLKHDKIYDRIIGQTKNIQIQINNTAEIRRLCALALNDVDEYIRKFVAKKMKFIVVNNNLNYHDIIADLKERAVATFWYEMPFRSYEHTLNILRRDIHNKGINIIKYYVAERRQRIKANDDEEETFLRTTISLDYDNDNEVKKILDHNYCSSALLDRDIELSFNRLIEVNMYYDDLRTVMALKLLRMEEDAAFLKIAKILYPKIVKGDCCTEEIFIKLGRAKFLNTIRKYAHVNKNIFASFMENLRQAF